VVQREDGSNDNAVRNDNAQENWNPHRRSFHHLDDSNIVKEFLTNSHLPAFVAINFQSSGRLRRYSTRNHKTRQSMMLRIAGSEGLGQNSYCCAPLPGTSNFTLDAAACRSSLDAAIEPELALQDDAYLQDVVWDCRITS
jgi:hypothetical protein